MTRPKADSDPWLTDPISRDRVIAKTVVEGMRSIIGLLRTIRDENSLAKAFADENRDLRAQLQELREEVTLLRSAQVPHFKGGSRYAVYPYTKCPDERCSLPVGHLGNHRGSIGSGA